MRSDRGKVDLRRAEKPRGGAGLDGIICSAVVPLRTTIVNRQRRNRLTASVLTFVMLFQIVAGIFAPVNIFNLKKNEAHAGWFDMGYGYKKEIKVDHTKVATVDHTDQNNFPMLVSFTDPALKTVANGGKVTSDSGYDIIFTNASGTQKFDHEIEKYVPTTGEVAIWVKIPVLFASVDTSIYIYYGNAAITTTQENKTGVWDDGGSGNFKMVQHMNQTGIGAVGDYKDSTQYANNSTSIANQPVVATGKIGVAENFDGTDDSIQCGNGASLNITDTVTLSAWVNISVLSTGADDGIISKSSFRNAYILKRAQWSAHLVLYAGDGANYTNVTSTQDLTVGQWVYMSGTATANGEMKLYKNGIEIASGTSGPIVNSTLPLSIGNDAAMSPGYFHGAIDEVHVSNTIRSADWIATEYNNQSQPTEFSTLGIEEVSSPSVLSSFAYRKAITIDHTKVSGADNLSNFPVLINLPTDASLAAHAQNPSGNDILFTSSSVAWNTGTVNDKLAHEIETYTTANGSLQAWVKIPSLNAANASQDTVIYMYYGNTTATNQQNKTVVWDTNTKMVQHMNQTGTGTVGDYKDSTQYGNNSANTVNQPTVTTSGKIGNAESFDGINKQINLNSSSSLNVANAVTLSAWAQFNSFVVNSYEGLIWKLNGNDTSQSTAYGLELYYPVEGKMGFMASTTGGNGKSTWTGAMLNTGSWYYLTSTYESSTNTTNLYINGNLVKTDTTSITGTILPYNSYTLIGKGAQTSVDGFVDEARISNTARSAEWIATEYNNQSQPTEFSTLGIEEVSSPSALSSFAYRKAITIDHTQVVGNANLTDFPVLINLPADASLQSHAQNPSGNDILFTSSSVAWNTGTVNDKLAHEIETYTSANGSLQAWVKIPSLNAASAAEDTVIYMYYGNGSVTSQQNKTAVWDTNAKMVQHMNQTGNGIVGDYKDSTQYEINSTNTANQPAVTTGQIGSAEAFSSASSNYILTSPITLNTNEDRTFSAWINPLTYGSTTGRIIDFSSVPRIYLDVNNRVIVDSNNDTIHMVNTPNDSISYNVSQKIDVVINGTEYIDIYINGILRGSGQGSETAVDTARVLFIGNRGTLDRTFNGSIDEVRISNTARSAAWIATEYNNQSQPTEFLSLGIEEVSAPAALSSFAYRKAITIDHTKVSGVTNLTNFPVLINLPADASLQAHAQNPSGNDILFTSSSVTWNTGTTNDKLAHEIETYATANGSLQAWVKIPSLNAASAAQDTVIYMYYGNGSVSSQQNKTAVWDTNTKMVQHLAESPSNDIAGYNDSDVYAKKGTPKNFNSIVTSTTNGVGQIDGADTFDGTDDYIYFASGKETDFRTSDYSVSFWAYRNNTNFTDIIGRWISGVDEAGDAGFAITTASNNRLLFFSGSRANYIYSNVDKFFNNKWQYITVSRVGANIKIYIDGVFDSGNSGGLTDIRDVSSASTRIGFSDRYINYNGSIDEVRVSNTARSADWIATEYNNQSQPTEFLSLGIEEVSSPSALSSFAYRKAITIDHAKVSGTTNLTNFPVLINLPADNSLKAHAEANGDDILFTSSTTNWNTGTTNDKLAHEIEAYTTATGSLQAWVKIPSLNSASAVQDTVIYMYYGNASATNQQNKTAVWDTNTKMVQHMNQTGNGTVGDYKDSTQYGNNSTNTVNQPTASSGQIDGAESFNGTDDIINLGTVASLKPTGDLSIGVWIKTNGNTGNYQGVVTNSVFGHQYGFWLGARSDNTIRFQAQNSSATSIYTDSSAISAGSWHYIAGVYSSQKVNVYIDGVFKSQSPASLAIAYESSSAKIGAFDGAPTAGNWFNGSIDEVRISSTARSADWIATEYNNQSIPLKTESIPAGFLSLGAEQIYRLEITGSAVQTVGIGKAITLTAKDAAGQTMTGFSGDRIVTFSGANAAPRGNVPTCTDKDGSDVAFGTPTTLNFTNGTATCVLKLYKAETAVIAASGIGTSNTALTITVSPNLLDNFSVQAPANSVSGASFAATITARDYHYNPVTSFSGTVALAVSAGSIAPAGVSSGSFSSGVWSGNLTISNITEQPSVAITASLNGHTGTDSISVFGVPQAPVNASASRVSDYSMLLTWQDSSVIETGYRIERKVNEGSGFGAYAEIGTVSVNVSTFTDDATSNPGNAPSPDRSYQYRVRAYNATGNSSYAEDSAIHYTTPDVPSNVFGEHIDDTSFRINYTDNADVTDNHHFQRCSNLNCGSTFETDLGTFTSSPRIDTTSLYPDSRYRWQARAEAPGVNSNYEVSNFEYTTPAAPVIQDTSYVSGSQLTINWQDASAYEDGFRIEVSIDGGAFQEVTLGTNTVGANVSSYAYVASPDHGYRFKVKAHIGSTPRNAELVSSYSGESAAAYTTASAATMQTPTVNSSTSIAWSWLDNSSIEENFHLHFVSGSGADINDIPANATVHETSGLLPNTAYSTHVHSYRADTGESDASAASDEVYTFANVPSDLVLVADDQERITADWNANQNPAGTEYLIENINTGTESDWITGTAWTSGGLLCGTGYSFRVKARNASSVETAYLETRTIATRNCSSGLPVGFADPPKSPTPTQDNPTGDFKVSIDDGNQYTKDTNVKLTFLAGADTTRMAVSNTPDFNQASLAPYQKEVLWNLEDRGLTSQMLEVRPQDGAYTVYAKFYTKHGITSKVVSDSIILDTTAPNLNITNLKDRYLLTDAITVQGATEPNSKVIYNLDSVRAGVMDIPSDGKLTLALGTLTAGTHSLKLITQDSLGNSSDSMQLFLNVEKPISTPAPAGALIPKPGAPTPTGSATTATAPTHQPGTDVPTVDASDPDDPAAANPDLDTANVAPAPPASMQGEWNLLSLKPFPKDISTQDIQMIIEKFPEFKETFRNLGLTDFSNAERLKNVSFNIPSLSEVMGLNPTDLTALNLPGIDTPIAELSARFKKGIPSNIVFVKTKESGIDVSSALSFEDGKPDQRVSLLSGRSFQLVLRPDQDVSSVQGYITFKESKLSRTDNTNIVEKVAGLFNFNRSALAENDIEEKLVLSEFEYQDPDQDGIWTADITTPQVSGEYELITVLNYRDVKLGAKTLRLITVVDPEGYVYRTEADGEKTRISNANVSIYWFNIETKKYELWDASKYQQQNPQVTDDRGTYSFLVPPGSYFLKAETAGYANYQSDPFDVTVGSGVHMNIQIKRQADWSDRATWQDLLLVVFGIALFYNYYGDRKRKKKRTDNG